MTMKTQAKSLVALAATIALGFGFTSCSKDEPKPDPEPAVETTFSNTLWLGEELLEYFDVTMTYTDVEGRVTDVKIKDCPEGKGKYYDDKGEIQYFPARMFTAECVANKRPAETSIKITYKYNGKALADEIHWGIEGEFKIGYEEKPHVSGGYFITDATEIALLEKGLNDSYSKWILKVDAQGKKTYYLGFEP